MMLLTTLLAPLTLAAALPQFVPDPTPNYAPGTFWNDDFGPVPNDHWSIYLYSKIGLVDSGVKPFGSNVIDIQTNVHGFNGDDAVTSHIIELSCDMANDTTITLAPTDTQLPRPFRIFTSGLCDGDGSPRSDYSRVGVNYGGRIYDALNHSWSWAACGVWDRPGGRKVDVQSDMVITSVMRCAVPLAMASE